MIQVIRKAKAETRTLDRDWFLRLVAHGSGEIFQRRAKIRGPSAQEARSYHCLFGLWTNGQSTHLFLTVVHELASATGYECCVNW